MKEDTYCRQREQNDCEEQGCFPEQRREAKIPRLQTNQFESQSAAKVVGGNRVGHQLPLHQFKKSAPPPQPDNARINPTEKDLEGYVVKAHEEMEKIWPKDKKTVPPMEPVNCCLLAHRHYCLWEPPPTTPIRLLIMAESHAKTDQSIVNAPVAAPHYKANLPHCGHLNLVHCLSYGESWLLNQEKFQALSKTARLGTSRGTSQFWRMLAALSGDLDCCDDDDDTFDRLDDEFELKHNFVLLESKNISGELRLRAKLRVMADLKRRGILLVDCSATPFYCGGGTEKRISKTGNPYTTPRFKFPSGDYKKLMKISWNEYSKYLLHYYKPEKFLVLGKAVVEALTVEEIEKEVALCGSNYLGYIKHPSCPGQMGKRFRESLRAFRAMGLECEPGNGH